jgi:hypothetical protein
MDIFHILSLLFESFYRASNLVIQIIIKKIVLQLSKSPNLPTTLYYMDFLNLGNSNIQKNKHALYIYYHISSVVNMFERVQLSTKKKKSLIFLYLALNYMII